MPLFCIDFVNSEDKAAAVPAHKQSLKLHRDEKHHSSITKCCIFTIYKPCMWVAWAVSKCFSALNGRPRASGAWSCLGTGNMDVKGEGRNCTLLPQGCFSTKGWVAQCTALERADFRSLLWLHLSAHSQQDISSDVQVILVQ